jgi:hypothetical protein
MPIQIPLWLENNTGSEWKKFVSDAQSAGMSVMQIMEAQQVALEKIRKSRANLGESLGNRTAQRYLNQCHPDRC